MIDYAHIQTKKTYRQLLTSVIVFTLLLLVIALASNSDYNRIYNTHSTSWVNCTAYYAVPCDENGELETNLSDREINALYEQDMKDEISLSDYEIMYLQAIDENN